MTDTKVMLIIETPRDSWKRDSGSVLACFLLVLPGWWIGSPALEWVGAIMFAVFVLSRASGFASKNTYTIQEARDVLAQMPGRDG